MIQSGTGDGGMAPGRKVKSFLWMSASLIVTMYIATKIHTPENIALQVLVLIGIGGLGTVLGQSAIDTFKEISLGKKAVAEAGSGKTTETTIITEKK